MKAALLLLVIMVLFIFRGQAQGIQMTIAPGIESISSGNTDTFHISLVGTGGFTQQISLTATSDLNIGSGTGTISVTFSANNLFYPYSNGSRLNVLANANLPLGQHWIAVTAANGPIVTHDTVNLNVVIDSCSFTSYGTYISFFQGHASIISVTVGNDSTVWAAHSGLYKYKNLTWTQYTSLNTPALANLVNDLKTDSASNVWLATNGGVVKFDGTFWSVYDTSNSGLTTSKITSLDIDQDGNFWISTSGKGIFKFDGTNWSEYGITNSGLSTNNIAKIRCDLRGNVYALAELAPWNLYKFNGTSWFMLTGSIPYLSGCVQDFSIDTSGYVWAVSSCINGGLFKLEGNQYEEWLAADSAPYNHFVKDISGNAISEDRGSGLVNQTLQSIYVDHRNLVWMAAATGGEMSTGTGLELFDGSGWAYYTESNSSLPYNIVEGLAEKNGTLWLTLGGGGFYADDSPYKTAASFSCPNISEQLTKVNSDTILVSDTTVTPTAILSVSEVNSPTLSISPNPVNNTGAVHLALLGFAANIEVVATNIIGQTMAAVKGIQKNIPLDISRFPAGIYFITASDGIYSICQKLVIQ